LIHVSIANYNAQVTDHHTPPDGISGVADTGGKLSLLALGEGFMESFALPSTGELMVGRAASADVRLEHPSISRGHARLTISPIGLTIEDMGSANGTRLRGEVIEAGHAVPLTVGEVIEVGSLMLVIQRQTTGAKTRRLWPHGYFEARVDEECARAARAHGEFSVLSIIAVDPNAIDRLEKSILDTVRFVDVVGTHSAGQLEILLIEVKEVESSRAVERLEQALASAGVRARLGVAHYPNDGRSADALLECAGRNARGDQGLPGPVVSSATMAALNKLAERVASGDISVLILGETGVGKDVLAERLHRMSPRATKPLLRLNCAALTEQLLESELFGHERGAFTGAIGAKLGLLETAHGGTVFLDEVGELPLSTQVKLLRVLEDRQVMRVGAVKSRPIDVRFLSATNRDLEAEIERGIFRRDLYFRLAGVTLSVPPLRERLGEVPGLVDAFLQQVARKTGRHLDISPEAMDRLCTYPWPGNIRELRNIIERAALLANDYIGTEHLPLEKMAATQGAGRRQPTPNSPEQEYSEFDSGPVGQGNSTLLGMPAYPPQGGMTTGVGLPAMGGPMAPNAANTMPGAPPRRGSHPPGGATPTATGVPAIPHGGAAPGAAHDPTASRRRLQDAVIEAERQEILSALVACGGNQSKAAALLGISRRGLIKKLEAYGFPRPRKG
jgi:transcriptional regulator with GAF, ATPase, and Fis domain